MVLRMNVYCSVMWAEGIDRRAVHCNVDLYGVAVFRDVTSGRSGSVHFFIFWQRCCSSIVLIYVLFFLLHSPEKITSRCDLGWYRSSIGTFWELFLVETWTASHLDALLFLSLPFSPSLRTACLISVFQSWCSYFMSISILLLKVLMSVLDEDQTCRWWKPCLVLILSFSVHAEHDASVTTRSCLTRLIWFFTATIVLSCCIGMIQEYKNNIWQEVANISGASSRRLRIHLRKRQIRMATAASAGGCFL